MNSGLSPFFKKILVNLAILSGLALTFGILTNTFDGDLGWHLRFGKEFWSGPFPYTDTYTYSKFGMPWVNHEWGGDVLFWKLYTGFGYVSLEICIALALWGAFLLIHKAFKVRLTLTAALVSVLSLWSVQHILVTRLAMLTPIFLAVLLYTLERVPDKKWYWAWPLLIWLWSALHGSWILAFIVVGIYIGSAVVENIWTSTARSRFVIPRQPRDPCLVRADRDSSCVVGMTTEQAPALLWFPNPWSWRVIAQVAASLAVSLGTIIINPYGAGIYEEVVHYFTQSFFKAHITEWVPSYTFPIFWHSMVLAAVVLTIGAIAIRRQQLTLAQILLLTSFFVSAMQYKRNMLLFVLVAAPLLASSLHSIFTDIAATRFFNSALVKKVVGVYLTMALGLVTLNYVGRTHIVADVWQDKALHTLNDMPYGATAFLQKETAGKKEYVFNYFSWGGYLNWQLPNALIYFDGRGTATWQYNNTETMLEHYYRIMFKPGGLAEIDQSPAHYILVRSPRYAVLPKPDWVNALVFTQDDLKKIFTTEPSELIKELTSSTKWQMVYTDRMAEVWKRK